MKKTSIIKNGDQVQDFTLKDHHNKELQLSTIAGKRVLLSFHPLAWTKVCAQQMKNLEEHYDTFQQLNTVALGISVDPVPTKHAWAKYELRIRHTLLLSDFWPHGYLAKELGLFREKDGFSERANIIIDPQKTTFFVKVYDISQLPDMQEIISVLKNWR